MVATSPAKQRVDRSMGRSPRGGGGGGGEEGGASLKKGPWTPEEDEKLLQFIQSNGHGSWRNLPRLAGLNRCGKSCRLRWTNYLRPDIKRGKFEEDEEQTILHLHSILGNKWSAIATHLPGRTDNEIKNYWNTHLKKRLIQMGFDPTTHRPRTDFFDTLPQLVALAALRDRLAVDPAAAVHLLHGAGAIQATKLQYLQCLLQSAATNIVAAAASVPDGDAGFAALGAVAASSKSQQGTTTTKTTSAAAAAAAAALPESTPGDHQLMSCTFSEEYPAASCDEANQHHQDLLLGCGGAGDHSFEHCHDGSLPPLTDVSVDGRCNSATASSTFVSGATSPLPWPEFFHDDPFLAGFL